MTSTSFNVGLRDGQRLSSRVLRPPGGAHSNIFGETEPQPIMQNDPIPETDNACMQAAAAQENQIQETNGAPEPVVIQDKLEPEAPQPEEVQPEEPVAQQPTPAAAAPAAPAAPAASVPEAPRRTRVPPGGYSSGLW